MLKKHEQLRVYDLLESGMAIKDICERTGFSMGTIYKYKRLGRQLQGKTEQEPQIDAVLEPYKELVDKMVKRGKLRINTLYFELQQAGYTGPQAPVERYYKYRRQLMQPPRPLQQVESGMGEQAQVDWGHFGEVVINGKREKVYLFAYILGWSRVTYFEFVVRQNQRTLQECHMHAFEKVGLPKTIVYDNMKTVVLRRIKQPGGEEKVIYNELFMEFARYYQFEVFACPPYWPRTKGKVEASIKYVRHYFPRLSVKYETTLEDLNARLHAWIEEQAHERIHGTTKEKPSARWQIEKDYLRFPDVPPYADSPLQTYYTSQNGLLVRRGVTYNLGPRFARRKLEVREIRQHGLPFLEVYRQNELVRTIEVPNSKSSWVSVPDLEEADEEIESKAHVPKVQRKKRAVFDIEVEQRDLSHYSLA